MNPQVKDALVKAFRTFLIATAAIAIPGLLGWLNDLTEWAHSNGTTQFPDAHGLLFILVAAISAGFIAVLNFAVVLFENLSGHAFLRNPVPPADPGNGEAGQASVLYIALVALVVVVILILVF